jgi:hypothetical protein
MGGLLLGGCDALSRTEWFPGILKAVKPSVGACSMR